MIPAFAGMTIEKWNARQFLFVTPTKVGVQLAASKRIKLDFSFRWNDGITILLIQLTYSTTPAIPAWK